MTTTATPIRRNADGQRNLHDLRAALALTPGVSLHPQGGQWIVGRWSDAYQASVETPLHHSVTDERCAIEMALGMEDRP